MRPIVIVFLAILIVDPRPVRAQIGGNIGYSQAGGKAKAEQAERARRVLTKDELPPTETSMFVEANVLMNVKADEYVALFGILQEGETVAECNRKMDATVKELTEALRALGIEGDDLFVDFAAQNRIYGFEVTGEVAREKLVGFELKKNLVVHYKDRTLFDKIVSAAARSQVFDLIKVDYIVKDADRIQDKLMDEAARVIKQKIARYEKLLSIKLRAPVQVYAERPGVHYPSQMYDSYTAYESEQVGGAIFRQNYTVQGARKSKTFFFNGLDADGFDAVVNPVVIEPVVQFTLFLKVKYQVEPTKAQ